MFHTPVWEYQGYTLVARPDTPNLHITWKDPRSGRFRRQSTGTSDLEAAQAKLIAFAADSATPTNTRPDRVALLDVLCDHVERVRPKNITRQTAPVTALKHFTEFAKREHLVWVSDMDVPMQDRYIAWRRDRLRRQGHAASNGTLNRELGVLKAALRHAWKMGRLDDVQHVRSLPQPPSRERFLSAGEVNRLLACCEHDHLRLFVLLAVHTLQRPKAIFRLRVRQVYLAMNRIDFREPDAPLTNKRYPVVPITRTLRPHMEAAVEASRSGYVLEYKGEPLHGVKRSFANACERAGLLDVTPYVLRHTGATLLAAAGVPLWQIAGMLGHSNTKTTEIYAKHQPQYLHAAVATLDELFPEHKATHGTLGSLGPPLLTDQRR